MSKKNSVDEWFKSKDYKTIRMWLNNQREMLNKVEEITKECKNDYDVTLFYDLNKNWFGGQCYYGCELWGHCKRGERKETYIDEKGNSIEMKKNNPPTPMEAK